MILPATYQQQVEDLLACVRLVVVEDPVPTYVQPRIEPRGCTPPDETRSEVYDEAYTGPGRARRFNPMAAAGNNTGSCVPALPQQTYGVVGGPMKQTAELFTIRARIRNIDVTIEYGSVVEMLDDVGLAAVFNEKLVSSCAVYCGAKLITKLPNTAMTLKRLLDHVVANSTTILRDHPAMRAT